jgi:hypothetical protein
MGALNMTCFYSPSQRGFFDPARHDSIPSDAVPVSAEDYAALFTAQSQGAQIVPGPGGAPTLLWPTPPTEAELLAAWRAATKVSAFQAKGALLNRGLLEDATAAATAAGGLTLLAWQTATEYARLSPAIVALAPAIGITDPEDLDDLFREAAVISA